MSCLFCKIVNGEVPAYTLYEDDLVKVFLDVNPKHNGHALVIPKKHYKDLFDIDINTLTHINKVAIDIGNLIKKKLHCDGITLNQNNGIAQEVKHFHLHIVPKYKTEDDLTVSEVYNILKKD